MERIWLADVDDGLGITWLEEKGGIDPVEYVRADLHESLTLDLKEARERLDRATKRFQDISFEQFLQIFDNWTGGDADEVVCEKVYDELLKEAKCYNILTPATTPPQPKDS